MSVPYSFPISQKFHSGPQIRFDEFNFNSKEDMTKEMCHKDNIPKMTTDKYL